MKFWRSILNGEFFSTLPHWIRDDFWRKVFALVLAGLLAGLVYSKRAADAAAGEEVVWIQGVPVSFEIDPSDAEEYKIMFGRGTPPKAAVSLQVRAPRDAQLSAEDFIVRKTLTLADYNSNAQIAIEPRDAWALDRKRKATVLRVDPAMFTVNLDRQTTKVVPVKLNYSLDLPPKYELIDLEVVPDEVRISGPEKALAAIQAIETRDFSLADAKNGYMKIVDLASPQDYVQLSAQAVQVTPEIVSRQSKSFLNVPIRLLNSSFMHDYVCELKPDRVDIAIETARSELTAASLHPFVDLSQIDPAGLDYVEKEVPIRCWSDNNSDHPVVTPEKTLVCLKRVARKKEAASNWKHCVYRGVKTNYRCEPGVTLAGKPNVEEVTLEVLLPQEKKIERDDFMIERPLSVEDVRTKEAIALRAEHVVPREPGVPMQVLSIEPCSVSLPLDEFVAAKEVPINPVYDVHALPAGAALKKLVVPMKVTLSGPKSVLDSIGSVSTEKIPLLAVMSKRVVPVPLVSPSPYVQMSREQVNVTGEIALPRIFEFRDIPIRIFDLGGDGRAASASFAASSPTGSVSIQLLSPQAKIKKEQVRLFVDVSDSELSEGGSFYAPVRCRLPDETLYKVLSIEPESVQINVKTSR